MKTGYPRRHEPRLHSYDYSTPGVYFLTVCTKNKACILSKISTPTVGGGVLDAPRVQLTVCGKAVETTIQEVNRRYSDLSIDKYVIMPNHIHLLVSITEDGASGTPPPTTTGEGAPSNPANAKIPKLISTLKRFTNKACGKELWQRGYHDHVIRDDRDYGEIWQYIDGNPARWAEDRYAPQKQG